MRSLAISFYEASPLLYFGRRAFAIRALFDVQTQVPICMAHMHGHNRTSHPPGFQPMHDHRTPEDEDEDEEDNFLTILVSLLCI